MNELHMYNFIKMMTFFVYRKISERERERENTRE